MQNYNYAAFPANLHMGEEWLRGFNGVKSPIPLLFANWAQEKFRVMILHASINLPSTNYESQQGAERLPKIANIHTDGNKINTARWERGRECNND